MHIDEMLAYSQRTVLLAEPGLNLMLRELKNESESLRCAATSIDIGKLDPKR
jgi:hypothetical protein